jgi:predicted CXXCH cytochrome family protein
MMTSGKWLGAMAFVAASAPWADGALPGYADSTVCAACHRQIADTYSKTGMSRSFRSVGTDSRLPELESSSYDHAPSSEHFLSQRRDGKYYIRRTTAGGGGQATNSLEEPVDYTVGSGDHAVNYLHRTRDNQLVEIPITWYAESGGHWGMSPGYDRPRHPGFSRAISYRCMFCHNQYPDLAGGPGNWDGATVFPAQLPEGIDCQRCHGPAASHVEAARQGRPSSDIRAAVVNPARLTPERQMEVCMECHLETTSTELPGAIMRFERSVFSYRPGEPLSDYILFFDHAPGTGHDDKFEFVSSVYRLRKSACFQASEGRLTCTNCHDPHQAMSREDSLRRTDRACAACHEASVAGLVSKGQHTAATECATCHMPRRQGVDVIHATVTDHWIQRPAKSPAPAPVAEENDGNTLPYAGEVVPYYPKLVEPLYAAIAQVNGLANLPGGLAGLQKLLANSRPKKAAPYFEMGEAFARTAQAGRSIPFYEQAVGIEPGNWRYLYALGQALQATGKLNEAVVALERAAALAPYETSLRNGLGVAYALEGRASDAVRTLRDAVSRNPEDATAQQNLGQALVRANDLGNAEAAFREAVRLLPESGELRLTLAEALMQFSQFRDAAFQLEEAIRSGPSTQTARSAWFAGLADAGGVTEARMRYDQSLRQQISIVHDDLGNVMISLGDAEAAIREYRLAADSDPRSPFAALNLGLALAGHSQPAEARQWLESALRLDPRQPAAHLKLGELLLAAGLRKEGIAHLRIAASCADPRIRSAAERLLESAK